MFSFLWVWLLLAIVIFRRISFTVNIPLKKKKSYIQIGIIRGPYYTAVRKSIRFLQRFWECYPRRGQFCNCEIEEEIQEEQENTRSFAAETTKWEKMRQAGQKLVECALTAGTIKSYENLWNGSSSTARASGICTSRIWSSLDRILHRISYVGTWIMETCESEGSAHLSNTKGLISVSDSDGGGYPNLVQTPVPLIGLVLNPTPEHQTSSKEPLAVSLRDRKWTHGLGKVPDERTDLD